VAEATGQAAEGAESANGDQAQPDGEIDQNANGGRQVVQRAVDGFGDIIEITLNENGEIVGEDLVGNVNSLPVEEEYVDEEGRTVSRVRDESGNAFERILDDEGNMAGVRAV
jgi:uncharacterized protein YuzE